MPVNGQSVCRACFSEQMYMYLPLGDHPPANAFVRPEHRGKDETFYPLNTHVCLNCALIQVPDPLPSDYYVDYVYVPSGSFTMPIHFRTLAQQFKAKFISGPEDVVVDIGCNNGLLLAACNDEGVKTYGIDPSTNITELAKAKNVEVVNCYFGEEAAKRIVETHPRAKVIVTTNTLNHIDDLPDFMRGVDLLLVDDGIFVIEAPQALTCIEQNEFDTIYHEHLSIFSAASVVAMGQQVGLQLVDIEELPIHGGSMRLFLRRNGTPSAAVKAYLEREKQVGLFEKQTYDAHAARVERIRKDLMNLIAKLKAEGATLAGYSAPAKGNTLLNYYGIGQETLPYIADRNELKHGRTTPGTGIPIAAPSRIDSDPPDYLLVLAWNFRDEILEQFKDYRAAGGKLIFPIPEVEIVG